MVSETAVMCAPPGIFEEAEPAPDQPLFLGPDARALRTPLGAICAPHSVAVRVDMPIVQARLLLARETIVVVLTYDDEVRGILSAALPHPPSALDELDECADAIPESAPLVEAIELMVHRHVRLVPLIGDGRRFAGLVSDLDVLRWATRQHNRSESSAARARDVLSKRVPAKEPTS
jgi:predicted transcriptional regulator